MDFYCIDNLPVGLLTAFAREYARQQPSGSGKVVRIRVEQLN